MATPKQSVTMRFSDGTLNKIAYLGRKLEKKPKAWANRTRDIELIVDRLYKFYKDGTDMFENQ